MSWVIEGFDADMQADVADEMSRTPDVFVFGRVTYEIVAAYRPDAVAYDEGDELNPAAGNAGPPGRFPLQAAIAAPHAQAASYAETDWPQILTLYGELLRLWPSPVVALDRAVAVSMVDGPQAALAEVEALERDRRLAGYRYPSATKADLLRRLGRDAEAADAYRAALALRDNAAQQEFLAARVRSTQPEA